MSNLVLTVSLLPVPWSEREPGYIVSVDTKRRDLGNEVGEDSQIKAPKIGLACLYDQLAFSCIEKPQQQQKHIFNFATNIKYMKTAYKVNLIRQKINYSE